MGNRIYLRNFTPLSLSPFRWLDASDATTLYTDAGSTLVSSDGQFVQEWHDKSGNNYDASNSGTESTRPVYKTSDINSKSALDFDGDAFLNLDAASEYIADIPGYTSFIVMRSDTLTGDRTGMHLASTSSAPFGGYYPIQRGSAGQWMYDMYDTSAPGWKYMYLRNGSPALDSNPHIWGIKFDTTDWRCYEDGVEKDTETGAGNIDMNTGLQRTVGRNNQGVDRYWDGRICEILEFNRALDSSDMFQINSYLKEKWGI